MKKLFSVMLQAFAASALAITTACTEAPTAGNNNQTNGNVGLQAGGNANAAEPAKGSAPAKAEQTGTGSIEVKSTPPGARVILIALDEEGAEPQQRGSTPTTLTDIPVGKYTVDVEKTGYKFYQKNIKVQENKTVQVNASLQKE
ncbi:MAG TPA: PEGA domain-containing protein [Blastocatellia bacterium]|nr:PEGA domain-containing protein [Blastocatellia bacterium]